MRVFDSQCIHSFGAEFEERCGRWAFIVRGKLLSCHSNATARSSGVLCFRNFGRSRPHPGPSNRTSIVCGMEKPSLVAALHGVTYKVTYRRKENYARQAWRIKSELHEHVKCTHKNSFVYPFIPKSKIPIFLIVLVSPMLRS